KVVTNLDKYNMVVAHCYYIVDISNILRPRYFSRAFMDKLEAENTIRLRFKGNFRDFKVELGTTIAKYGLRRHIKIQRKLIPLNLVDLKYSYPPERVTLQQRKDWRTLKRRKMREWMKKLENV